MKRFSIEFNIGGDDRWDNQIDYETFEGTYDDIKHYLGLSDAQVEELKRENYLYDEGHDNWKISDVEDITEP